MLPPLINHSPDLKQLWDEGYVLEIRGAFLLVHEIPYVNSKREIKKGTLVSTLNLSSAEKQLRPKPMSSTLLENIHVIKMALLSQEFSTGVIRKI